MHHVLSLYQQLSEVGDYIIGETGGRPGDNRKIPGGIAYGHDMWKYCVLSK